MPIASINSSKGSLTNVLLEQFNVLRQDLPVFNRFFATVFITTMIGHIFYFLVCGFISWNKNSWNFREITFQQNYDIPDEALWRGFKVEVGEDDTERDDFDGLLVLLLPLRLYNSSRGTMLWAEIKIENFVKSIGRKFFTWNHRLLRISRCWCLKFDNSGNTESAFKIDWDTFGAEIDLSLALAIGAGSSSTDCWSVKKFSWNQFRTKRISDLLFTFLLVWIWNEPPSRLRLSTKVRRSRSTEPARILKRDKKFREIKWSLIFFFTKKLCTFTNKYF